MFSVLAVLLTNCEFQNGALPFNKFEFLVMWMFRECGAPYLFLHSILNPDVRWRKQQFRLRWGGKAEPAVMRTKANVIEKDPATIKFSTTVEQVSPMPAQTRERNGNIFNIIVIFKPEILSRSQCLKCPELIFLLQKIFCS